MEKTYDLCVTGAGFAGAGAAVRAARMGLKTVLIEQSTSWGGTARDGLHEFLCGLYASGTEEPKRLNDGLCEELEKKLKASGARAVKMGKIWALEYRLEDLQEVFQSWAGELSNLDVLFDSTVGDVLTRDGKIRSVAVRSRERHFQIHAGAFIDCTGGGELIRRSGASYEISPAPDRQLAAYAFQLENVAGGDGVENLKLSYALAKAAETGQIAPHLKFTVWIPKQKALRIPVLPSDSGYDLRAIQEHAKQVHAVLKRDLPAFQASDLGRLGDCVVERESLRMAGRAKLTRANVLNVEKYRDGVKSSWPVEFWSQLKGPRYDYLKDGDFYEIPGACLQSKSISNLFAAGKCISADPWALASARMTATCLAMGERSAEMAAGLLKKVNIVSVIRGENRDNLSALAFREGVREITFGELFEQTDRLAEQLQPFVKPFSRVGIFVPEGIEYVILNLAVLSLRGVVVPLSENSTLAEVGEMIESVKLNLLIFDPALYSAGKGPELSSGNIRWRMESFESRMENQDRFEALNPAFIRFTSGTTGQSKGVVLSHEAILARTTAAGRALNLGREDRVLWVLSMAFHFVVTILFYLRRGASAVLCGHEIPKGMLEGLALKDITFLYAIPTHYQILLNTPGIDRSVFLKVRMAVSTAMAMPEGMAEKFREKFGIELTSAYGIIEAGLPFIDGWLTPGYECRLLEKDETGAGVICLKGGSLYGAYFNPWRETEPDAWFETGDFGRFSRDGRLELLGRRSRVINFSGMKIFPEEIEKVLEQFPGVAQAHVYGQSHPVYGQLPCAKVVADEADEEKLRIFCYGRLPKHKVPKSFEFIQALKINAAGKIIMDQRS